MYLAIAELIFFLFYLSDITSSLLPWYYAMKIDEIPQNVIVKLRYRITNWR